VPLDETCRTAWGSRLLGLAVLLAALALGAWLLLDGGAPAWTWAALSGVGLIAGLASVANFGDRWTLDDGGITYRNVLTARLGLPRERRLAWEDVLRASEYEGRTWFLSVEGGRRWVLDHLAEHDRLGVAFQQLGIPVDTVEKPRLWRRGADDDPRGPLAGGR
jgi:hypothetical protein